MSIRRIPIFNETQWQAMRMNNIGASEVGALLDVHDYLTPLQLWARKIGRVPPAPETAPMKRGRKLEPVAIEMIAEEYPTWKIERPAAYFSDDDLRLGATPDLFATDPERGLGVVQIKCVEPSVFRRTWFVENDMRPPLWIAVQALTEAHLTGAQWAACAALVVSYGIDLHVVEVPIVPALVQRIRDETAKFWHLVDTKREPVPDYGRDLDLIRTLYPTDDGSEIDLTGDNELPAIIERRQRESEQEKASKAAVDTCNAMILAKLGAAQIGRFSGGYVSAKTINRKGYEVQPTQYRSLRVVVRKNAA